jgi:hypothetical protein
MKPTLANRTERMLTVLLRDYDYFYVPKTGYLIEKGIKGYSRDEVVACFSSLFLAAEHLIRSCGTEYFERFDKITNPTEEDLRKSEELYALLEGTN